MDEFGVLVESIGFKSRGNSAPMAKLKQKPKSSQFTPPNPNNTASFADSFDDLDGIFASSLNINKPQNFFVADDNDIFGVRSNNQYVGVGGVDIDSLLSTSKGGSNFSSVAASHSYDDLLGLNSKGSDPVVVDDVFGSFVVVGSTARKAPPGRNRIPPPPPPKGAIPKANLFPELNVQKDDPFSVFESSVSDSGASWPFVSPSGQGTSKAFLDELDSFAMGMMGHKDSTTNRVRSNANKPSAGATSNGFGDVDDLDAIFGSGVQPSRGARPTSVNQGAEFDMFFPEEKKPVVKHTTSWSSPSKKKTSPATSITEDFNYFGDAAASSQEFHEIEGEPPERRRARLNRHMRMNARMAEALAEKNQRDHQSNLEQEEKHRLAETLNNDIKRWAMGKEGNLRALLSSLQQILSPECGWRPVSLTDMITSDSVKKVYKKATLYVHPDKVQQKGATLRQKYIAEKVFDLLKEAWNKFSAEELR